MPQLMVQNGKFIDYEDAVVHVMSPAVKYGFSVFEGIRAYWNERDKQLYVFRLRDHTDRLFQSMKLLRFKPTFDRDEIDRLTLELIRRNDIKSSGAIRVCAYIDGRGEQESRSPVGYVISAGAKGRDTEVVEKGIRAQVSSWIRIADNSMPPRIKTAANYVNSSLARVQATQDGYGDAILLNQAGKVSEATGSTLLMVRRGKVVVPNLTSAVLESITRDTIMRLAVEAGLEVEEREVEKTELYAAEEIFFCGSAAEVKPVIDVDGMTIGSGVPGPITRKLQSAYFDAISGVKPDNKGWLTPVYTG